MLTGVYAVQAGLCGQAADFSLETTAGERAAPPPRAADPLELVPC